MADSAWVTADFVMLKADLLRALRLSATRISFSAVLVLGKLSSCSGCAGNFKHQIRDQRLL
jgi:hypothetical protein